MKMTCVNRLNYNYYYFAFDVVRQSNYKMLKKKEERGREEMREKQGVFPARVIKTNLCGWENRVWSRQCLMYDSK